MGRILRDLYGEASIAPLIGFKGGTCAYFFYDLPRFSVDLDFDLLSDEEGAPTRLFEAVRSILARYGEVRDARIKRFTIFFLLSYGDADHNVKVEINTRMLLPDLRNRYEPKDYLGIPLLAGKKEYLFGGKLAALTLRGETAMRDIYDIWFFADSGWNIDASIVEAQTGKSVKDHLADCIALIEGVKDNEILHGLGELLSEKDKVWVKQHLREEVIFLLRNYRSVL